MLAVTGGEGGVGKTTTALGLGITVLGARFDDEEVLAPALDELSNADRPVVLDCPAGAGAPVATPLGSADRSLVVVRRTERALVDGRKAAALARRFGAEPVGVVVSRDGQEDGVGAAFDAPVVAAVPDLDDERPWRDKRVCAALSRAEDRQNV